MRAISEDKPGSIELQAFAEFKQFEEDVEQAFKEPEMLNNPSTEVNKEGPELITASEVKVIKPNTFVGNACE